jgi:hypothetical protein
MRKAAVVSLAMMLMAIGATAQVAQPWKTFANRGGWSVSYPAGWRIASCKSCKDPTAPGVFVDFFPPHMKTAEGWVMAEPLADRPSSESVDAWLTEVSRTNNANLQINEGTLTLNGLPALKVRYRVGTGVEMETVYIVSGSQTFAVEFSGDLTGKRLGIPLDKLGNYAIYLKIVDTFHFNPR